MPGPCARGRRQIPWLRQMETRSDRRFAQLTQIQSTPDEGHHQPAELDPPAAKDEIRSRIDKSLLTLPETKRLRDKQHLRFVAKQPCLVCGREPCDPHHLRFAQSARSGTQGQRRIHGPAVPGTPSRTAPHRQGIGLVGESRSRAHRSRAQALAGNPPASRFC